jgi:hypothetical protein
MRLLSPGKGCRKRLQEPHDKKPAPGFHRGRKNAEDEERHESRGINRAPANRVQFAERCPDHGPQTVWVITGSALHYIHHRRRRYYYHSHART